MATIQLAVTLSDELMPCSAFQIIDCDFERIKWKCEARGCSANALQVGNESLRLRWEQATREGNERMGAKDQEAISRALADESQGWEGIQQRHYFTISIQVGDGPTPSTTLSRRSQSANC
jgi:hypothetical protein